MNLHIDSFSGRYADLPPTKRTAGDVLAVLQEHPCVSCFDLYEISWPSHAIADLERRGAIKQDYSESYPWVRFTLTTKATTHKKVNL